MKLARTVAVSSVILWFWGGVSLGSGSHNVEIIVNQSLYNSGDISAALNQYISDACDQGYNPILTPSTFTTAAEIRSHLASTYGSVGLAGAILIGDLPAEHFERNGQFDDPCWYERFPCDLYYEDLNGSWSDATGNGTYDKHTGDARPEIWVGRMTASPLTSMHDGRTEASLLNDYFQKNHAYRTKQLSVLPRGLAYIDDDWIPYATTWANNLSASVTGGVTTVSSGVTTTASDYKSRILSEYESLLLAAHSSSGGHAFKIGSEWTGGSVYSSDIAGLDPQILFYNLFCCSNANYEATWYMGGEYLFGTSKGLVAVGSTKTGSMLNFDDYYDPLGQGKTFGQSLLAWWQAQASDGTYSNYYKDWFYGMTLLGDPLLLTQQYIPEPATLSLLALGTLTLLRRRR
jgi:hypothetical protein